MTDLEANVAVAEMCGWTPCNPCGDSYRVWIAPGSRLKTEDEGGGIEGYCCPGDKLPDYGGDLNVMREAERWLQEHWGIVGWANYGRLLAKLNQTEAWTCPESDAASATAAQRREAFLRTIGKWRD